jgi:cytosine permease
MLGDIDDTNVASLDGKGILGSVSGQLGVLSLICAYVVGFFATAGAAGCDFGSNNKNRSAVKRGGLVGIVGATIFTGAIALIAVAGAQWTLAGTPDAMNPYAAMKVIMGDQIGGIFMLLLAIAAFPSACFSTLIAANSFKTTLPKVDPFISCGIGAAMACVLILTGFAGQAGDVFTLIGASFGPVCGAMMADYILAGRKWAGPRAGFNPAGWISWIVGFAVGGVMLFSTKFVKFDMPFEIPCPPVSAFVVGLVLYYILAKLGLESKKLDMPQRIDL